MAFCILLHHDQFVADWVCSRGGGSWAPGDVGIGLVEFSADSPASFNLVAGVVFNNYRTASIQLHTASDLRRAFLPKAFLGAVFQYAFLQCGVKKILAFVGAGNTRTQEFSRSSGFLLEATIPDAHVDGELLIFSLTAANCRWLQIPVPKESFYHGQF